MAKFSCVILHNIISPYKTLLFNALELTLKEGFEVRVLYLGETRSSREWSVDKNELKFPFDIIFNKRIDDIDPIKMAIETYRKLNFYNPEIIIVGGYSYLAYWSAFVWAKKKRRKLIVINESHYLDKPRSVIKESIKKLFVSNCDAALVAGRRHKDYAVGLGLKPEKIFIKKGPGPIDVSWYQKEVLQFRRQKLQICKELGIPHKNFLFVGRFSPEKNIMFLLKVYKRLKDEGAKDWGLILVGNGPQREEIESFMHSNNIKDVFLPGFKQKGEIPLFYAISDVFILPSLSEPWGLVVSEAMASDLPVLVSRQCGCYPDIVHDDINGLSFDPHNEDELYNLMRYMVRGKYNLEEMGKASLAIIKDYTPEKAAKVVVDAISFVLKKDI